MRIVMVVCVYTLFVRIVADRHLKPLHQSHAVLDVTSRCTGRHVLYAQKCTKVIVDDVCGCAEICVPLFALVGGCWMDIWCSGIFDEGTGDSLRLLGDEGISIGVSYGVQCLTKTYSSSVFIITFLQ